MGERKVYETRLERTVNTYELTTWQLIKETVSIDFDFISYFNSGLLGWLQLRYTENFILHFSRPSLTAQEVTLTVTRTGDFRQPGAELWFSRASHVPYYGSGIYPFLELHEPQKTGCWCDIHL